ncbi:MAG: hypothetical protein MZU79_02340 [Anaerotruncus sp.]|nr:hypothetical protein [Anaerotruncus sp.]
MEVELRLAPGPAPGRGRPHAPGAGAPESADQRPPGHGGRPVSAGSWWPPGWSPARPVRCSSRWPTRAAGFQPEERERLFRPFYSTKKPGQGTGLGLSISLIDRQGAPGPDRGRGRPGPGRHLHRAAAGPLGRGRPRRPESPAGRGKLTCCLRGGGGRRRGRLPLPRTDALPARASRVQVFSSAEGALAWPGAAGGGLHRLGREDARHGRRGVPGRSSSAAAFPAAGGRRSPATAMCPWRCAA